MMEKQLIPTGYKETEVGAIPEDWLVKSLDLLGNGVIPPIKAGPFGSSLTKDIYVAHGYKVYGQEQVIKGDCHHGDYYINEKKYRDLFSCSVREGDILLSLVGTAGKLLIISKDAEKGVINPRLLRFTFDKKIIISEFFKFLFESDYFQNILSRSAQGGTMAVLNAGMLRILEIPIPRLEEQTAIANALSDVDALIAALETLINKKSAIKTAAMQQLLTGKKRLPPFDQLNTGYKQTELGEIPGDWEVKNIGSLCSYQNGTTQEKYFNQHDGYTVISIGNYSEYGKFVDTGNYIDRGFESIVKKFVLKKDDLAMILNDKTAIGTIIGRVLLCDADDKYVINQRSMRLTTNGIVTAKYLHFLINSDLTHKSIVGMAKPGTQIYINTDDVLGLNLLFPKDPEEQTAIANVLSDMDKDLEALQQRLHKTQQIKQGMMQELLTGKTRLV